ncbi:MAG TPA: sensor domain-containing diguanylate cyclase [Longimicrobiaceae bacterium]|nr:sensor domain-containing diguanylate cyclase [Longimicrobiaceae bacterium]
MRDLHCLTGADLDRFLARQKANAFFPGEVDFAAQLREILDKAGELVPAESGCILLDDPLLKQADRARNELCFVAAYGPASPALPGRRFPASDGIAGRVYRSGQAHLSQDAQHDRDFSMEVDQETGHRTHSMVAVPISIGATVCGVIELINRTDGVPFNRRDLLLLEIFASYTSSALQNALDARRAAELARRDDLTGLANDRWLHQRLVQILAEADAAGEPCSLIFFDLDGFKAVNDRHGHLAGSQVLREVGFLLTRVVTTPGAVLSRYGGDEFVIGLPRTSTPTAAECAEAIRLAIAENVFLDRTYGDGLPALDLRNAITASVGVATHAASRDGIPHQLKEAALLRRADTAMYDAKARGKNQVVVATC